MQRTVVIDPAKPPYAFQALGGVAVIADSTWAAMQGHRKLKVEWEPGDNAGYESEAYGKTLMETVRQPQKVVRNIGNVDTEFAKGGKIHEAEYYVPLLAHATLEPPAAVAEYKDDKVVAWAATQNPQAVQAAVASALGIDKKDVICHVTLLGGAFGRKSKPDYVVEAAILSKTGGQAGQSGLEPGGRHPARLLHSVAAMYMKAASAHGAADGMAATVASTRRSHRRLMLRYGLRRARQLARGGWTCRSTSRTCAPRTGRRRVHVRIGWLRSVSSINHAFGVQSFIDELAAAAGRDRIEYFLDVLGPSRTIDFKAEGTTNPNWGKPLDQYPWETGRLRRVVEVVAEKLRLGEEEGG